MLLRSKALLFSKETKLTHRNTPPVRQTADLVNQSKLTPTSNKTAIKKAPKYPCIREEQKHQDGRFGNTEKLKNKKWHCFQFFHQNLSEESMNFLNHNVL